MKTIDMMAQLFDKNNIPFLEGARKKEGCSSSENKERCHALVVGYSIFSSFTIDLGSSKHMESMHDYFSSLHPYSVPSILMGDDSEIQAKWIYRIDLEDGYFNNVLFVSDIVVKLRAVYQMTHNGTDKRLTFTQNDV